MYYIQNMQPPFAIDGVPGSLSLLAPCHIPLLRTRTRTHIQTLTHKDTHTNTDTQTHIQTLAHKHSHTNTHTHTHKHSYTNTHTKRHIQRHTDIQPQAHTHIRSHHLDLLPSLFLSHVSFPYIHDAINRGRIGGWGWSICFDEYL